MGAASPHHPIAPFFPLCFVGSNSCLPACQRCFTWPQLDVNGPEGRLQDDLALGRGLQVVDVGHGA